MSAIPSDHELVDFLAEIQLAAVQPAHWDGALSRLAWMLGADTAGVQVRSSDAILGGAVEGIRTGLTPDVWDAYQRKYQELDIVSAGAVALGPRVTFRTEDVVDPSELRGSEFWRDWAHPNGLDWLLATSIQIDGDKYGALGLCRPLKRGAFSLEQAGLLTRITPHLERAIQVHYRLRLIQHECDDLAALVDRLSVAIFLLDGHGLLVRHNEQAEQLLAAGDGLTRVRRRLTALRPSEGRMLERLVDGAAQSARGGLAAPGGLLAVSRSRRRPLHLLVTPLSSRVSGGRRVAVFVTDPDAGVPLSTRWLTELYALTPSEARTAALIVQGLSPAEAADRLQRSVETIRRQLKLAMQKLGVRRQAELVRFVLSGPRLRGSD